MSPPIFTPDGSEVSEIVLPDGSTASEVIGPDGNVVFEAGPDIPDSEDFEHNDLTGNYGGDTGYFSIQTGTVNGGTYALTGDGNGNAVRLVVRATEEKWGPPIRVTWDQYIPDQGADGEGLFIADSVTGFSSSSGYWIYSSVTGNGEIRRLDGGNTTSLMAIANQTSDAWVSHQLDWLEDGTLEVSYEGNTETVNDSTYTEGLLGFAAYKRAYWKNVQFEAL